MTEQAEEATLTVDELAARAGVTVRTIRFYSTRGLLPPPRIGPRRVGRYGEDHLARLALIEELQSQGMTLSAIERYLQRLPEDMTAQDLAVHRALVASWMPDTTDEVTREQLERRAGRPLDESDLRRLELLNVLERTDEAGRFVVDPGLLPLGVRLLELPMSQESVLAARQVLLDHARQVARELSKLFREEVWEPYRAQEPDAEQVERMKSLSAHMQPLVVQALLTAFQRSLREELRGAFPKERVPRLGG
ncbi:MerR family transcriptional regulator [Streptomyces alkaliterrae]|uniref:MerR family transcriptional regulator n=1 Tax=Streptomyces alkaliterrae TaxID=2213162 RepID=A0A5P0YWA0_9ACTN|nr:MerR family transcriptional regulator [Streptomyces alkaliterrae]MBB1254445.1 MerR family transcriptional regulator [Streptomyces alkaliterrae]MBB1260968.1 MerR family transcriptional regulator [Streptomyces alkaliterrae]MQS04561.1 MerR family transcriptional regulator [Streptomyces alkaliterrae]